MKKLILSILAVTCFLGVSFSQQDTTKTPKAKTQKEQKKIKNDSSKSSKRKMKQKTDSVNSSMDTTTRIMTR